MAERSCLDCFRTFLRIILLVANVVVSLLGLSVLIVGIWAKVEGNNYFDVVNGHEVFSQTPVLLIVVGTFVLLLGIVGIIGGIFANTIVGRIILGLYGFVLALLVIIEISGGIAAGVERSQLGSTFDASVNETFKNYNSSKSIQDTWDTVQRRFKCCGTTGYSAYLNLGFNIPQSCCKTKNCDTDNHSQLYTKGCTQEIRDFLSHNLGVISGVAITFGFLQIIGVVVSCFVAIAGRNKEENSYQVV